MGAGQVTALSSLVQDAFLPLKESKSCLIAIQLFTMRIRGDFLRLAIADINRHSIKSARWSDTRIQLES
jgi:hypothetical protein